MAERLEDLNLPVTAITRIAKEVLPPNVIVSKEAKTALARAASVFILYVSNQATTIATNRNKKTISAQDVLEALSQVDFDCLIEPLQQLLEGKVIISSNHQSPVRFRRGCLPSAYALPFGPESYCRVHLLYC